MKVINKITVYSLLCLFFLLSMIFCYNSFNNTQVKALQAGYAPHAPIFIDEDKDFEFYAFAGNGTKSDPYLIFNLYIEPNDDDTRCIFIVSTFKYFQIEGCYLVGGWNPT